ncbi:hypothetical protein HMPREF9540_02532 [Escherichia coli MS 115-1]|nr:hypothetical protein HMPREF9540_02532 [Escherichia coli MS 115-1]
MIKKGMAQVYSQTMHMYMYRQVAPKFCNCLLIIAFMFLFAAQERCYACLFCYTSPAC